MVFKKDLIVTDFERELENWEGMINKIIQSRIRNPFWREEATVYVMMKVWSYWKRQRRSLPEGLVSTIAANSCKDILRKHKIENNEVELPLNLFEDINSTLTFRYTQVILDLDLWMHQQVSHRQKVLSYVLSLKPYHNMKDLGERVGVSKATVARALEDLADYLRKE